ncbi:MAG: hypothetical protein ACHQ0I_04440 [Candidatus Lutacidiplasmatales archaeon]
MTTITAIATYIPVCPDPLCRVIVSPGALALFPLLLSMFFFLLLLRS